MGWKAAWSSPKVRQVLFWVIHVLIVLCIVVLLGFVNLRWNLDRLLLSPMPWLHQVWLPLLFLLLYASGWLALALWKYTATPIISYPALDDAFTQAITALKTANIELTQTPIILVFGGTPKQSAQQLLAASGRPLTINAEYGPLGVCATSEVIFFSLLDFSAWTRLSRRTDASLESIVPRVLGEGSDPTLALSNTVTATRAEELLLTVNPPQPADMTAEDLQTCQLGLQALVARLRSVRDGRAPINGCLWLVPWNQTANEERLESAILAVQSDAATLSETTLLDVPQTVAVVGCEDHAGFIELLQATPGRAKVERLYGRSWSPWPNVPSTQRRATIHEGLNWISQSLTPSLRMQFFQQAPAVLSAQQAWRWEYEQNARNSWLARWISEGIYNDANRPLTLLGVYFAGTGKNSTERGFLDPVLQELLLQQNRVSWRPRAHTADARALWLARFVVFFLIVSTAMVSWYCYWVLMN